MTWERFQQHSDRYDMGLVRSLVKVLDTGTLGGMVPHSVKVASHPGHAKEDIEILAQEGRLLLSMTVDMERKALLNFASMVLPEVLANSIAWHLEIEQGRVLNVVNYLVGKGHTLVVSRVEGAVTLDFFIYSGEFHWASLYEVLGMEEASSDAEEVEVPAFRVTFLPGLADLEVRPFFRKLATSPSDAGKLFLGNPAEKRFAPLFLSAANDQLTMSFSKDGSQSFSSVPRLRKAVLDLMLAYRQDAESVAFELSEALSTQVIVESEAAGTEAVCARALDYLESQK